jgi:hypothetical protein
MAASVGPDGKAGVVGDGGAPMDWARYRALCDRPEVMSRWLLVTTLAVLSHTDDTDDPEDLEDGEAEPTSRTASPPVSACSRPGEARDTALVRRAASALRAALAAAPLPRPADHRGPSLLDMFELTLPNEVAQALLDRLLDLAAAGRLAALLATQGADIGDGERKRPSETAFLAAWRERCSDVAATQHGGGGLVQQVGAPHLLEPGE